MLNFLRITLCSTITMLCVFSSIDAREMQDETRKTPSFEYIPTDVIKSDYVSKHNKYQIADWVVMDSLANSLSYLQSDIRPFGVDPLNPNLIFTVRRGSQPDPDGTSSDPLSKNHLFIQYTSDNGRTWSDAEKVYDFKNDGFGQGRYPSVFVKALDPVENNYVVNFVGTLVDEQASKWNGYVFGVALLNEGSYTIGKIPVQGQVTINDKTYSIGRYTFNDNLGLFEEFPSPTQILGYGDGLNDFRTIFPAMIRKTPFTSNAEAVQDNNNTAIVSTDDISVIDYTIPEPLKSENFFVPDSVQSRTSVVEDLRIGEDGNSYMMALNNYIDDELEQLVIGVSKSTDKGATWSEFEDFPKSKVDEYVDANWGTITSERYVYLTRYMNDFVVKDENNYSIIIIIAENTSTETGTDKNVFAARKAIIELYKENGDFGVRPVKDEIATFESLMFDTEGNNSVLNPMDYELQLARTYDGKNYFLKWVEGQELTIDSSSGSKTSATISMSHTDIFVSIKPSSGGSWSEAINITEGDEPVLNKGTWIPPYVPNDFNNIMLTRLITEGDNTYVNQRQYLNKQYIQTSLISSSDLNSVESDRELSNRIITNLYPNPAKSNISFDINFKKIQNNTTIALYNMDGTKVQDIYSGLVNAGSKTFNTSIKDLSQGTYIIKVTFDGVTVSQILKVVK